MCYFDNVFKSPHKTVDAICQAVKEQKFGNVDLIVGTGVSGILVLLPVSMRTKIPFGVVRKDNDVNKDHEDGGSHSNFRIELGTFYGKVERYIIIDDLIDTGHTVDQILDAMDIKFGNAKCVGIVLYQNFIHKIPMTYWRSIPVVSLCATIREMNQCREH